MKEEEITNLGPQEYFNYLEGINKKIIIELKAVCNLDTAKDTDNLQNVLIESSMALEHNIKNLLYFIDKCPISYDQIAHYHSHFKEVVKILFQVCQDLIKAAQSLVLNSCDYLTTSNFTKCRSEAIQTIKNTMVTCSNFEKLYYNPDLQLEDEAESIHQQQQQKEQEQQQKEQEQYEQEQTILKQLKDNELKKQQQQRQQQQEEEEREEKRKHDERERLRIKELNQQQQQQERERLEKERLEKEKLEKERWLERERLLEKERLENEEILKQQELQIQLQRVQLQQLQQNREAAAAAAASVTNTTTTTTTTSNIPPITLKTSTNDLLNSSSGNLSPKISSPGSPNLGKFTESQERVHNFDRGTANIILNMNKIKEISLSGDSEQAPEIVIAARVISENIAIISKELRYKTLGTNLSEHFVNVVQIARLAVKNKSDQFYQDQLELAIEKFNDTMRKIIYSVKSISKSSMNLRQFGVDESSLGRSPVVSPEKSISPSFTSSSSERVLSHELKNNGGGNISSSNLQNTLQSSPLSTSSLSSSQLLASNQQPNQQPIQTPPHTPQQDAEKQLKRKEKQHQLLVPKDLASLSNSTSPIQQPVSLTNSNNTITTTTTVPTITTTTTTTSTSTNNNTSGTVSPRLNESNTTPNTLTPGLNSNNNNGKHHHHDKHQENAEKQKTFGKLFSKLVHKKRTPLPGFDPNASGTTNSGSNNTTATTSTPSSQSSSSNSPMETSPSIQSPKITKSTSHQNLVAESLDISSSDQPSPITHSGSFSCGHLIDQQQQSHHQTTTSINNNLSTTTPTTTATNTPQSQTPTNISQSSLLNGSTSSLNKLSSPSLYGGGAGAGNKFLSTPKKERSFTIGMVSGKHSCIVLETPRSKKLFQHESAKQILSIISMNFPSFEKEFQMQNSEVISNIIEQIGNVLNTYHEEISGDPSNNNNNNNNSQTPSDCSPILNSSENYEIVSPALRKMYENGSLDSKEHSRSSIQSKISRKLGTIRKKPANPFNMLLSNSSSSNFLGGLSYNLQDPYGSGGAGGEYGYNHGSFNGGSGLLGTGNDEIDASEHLVTASSSFTEEAIELVNKCFEASIIVNHPNVDVKPLFISTLDHLESMLQSSVNFGKVDPSSFCMTFLRNIKNYIPTMKVKGGKCDPTLVTAATKLFRHTILSNLDKSIHSLCHSVRVLAIQMTIIVISISAKPWDISSQLQLFASAKSFIDSLVSLLDAVENKIYISTNTNIQDDVEVPTIEDTPEDVNIWEEPDGPSTFKIDWISDEGSKTGRYVPKAGTLNKLISALTQDNKHDISRYTKTFLLTYQSFTNPWKLMEKLIQRYNVPPNERPEARATTQLRVVSFMQTWIEKNFNDFDDLLISQLKEFRTRLLMDNNNDLAVILGGLIKKKENERNLSKDRSNTNLLTFPELMIPDGQKSPTALFLLLNESEIARQLTLIDFNIFSKIQPTELLDQSWNRDSLKFKSPNVIEMINRANKFSFWVSSQILWQEDIEDRVKVFEKFILISKYLREMNNFNTLLAIFTGLNTAPILRLKKTFAMISPNSLSIYNSLEKLMNSSGSYKNYRSVSKTPPLLPYLPVILSDLTFMEDGNPDKINNLINFQKRELICRVISEVQQCQQQTKYEFPVVEPIHTLLTELPSSTPSELYQLSLIREPRDSSSSSSSSSSGMVGGNNNNNNSNNNGNGNGNSGGSNSNNGGSISAGSGFLNNSNNNGFDTLKKYYKTSNNN